MPPVVIPAGHAQVTVHGVFGASAHPFSSVFGVEAVAPVQADADSLSTSLAAAYKTILSTNGSYTGLRVIANSSGTLYVLETTSGTGPGLVGGALVPPQVQVQIDKRALIFGPKGRGRTFLSDGAEASIDSQGILSAAAITLYNAFATNVMAAFNAGIVWNGMELLNTATGETQDVVSYQVDPKVSTRRDRYFR